jgi:glycosyltransferase involved in cell wall biosynthesis
MISVVIPAHNEAGELGKLLQEFNSFDGLELIVAVDASTDGTLEIVQEFAARNYNVILTHSSTLTGKGGAIKRGLAAATGDVLGFIDADRSIHPDDFMHLVDAINCGADLAIGSRKLLGSVILEPQPLLRRILGSAYAALARALLQTTERDLQCGCKAFRRSLWDALSVNCDGFAFDTELVAKAHKKGFAIMEVPITWRNKADSKIKVRRDVLSMFRCLLSVRAEIRRRERL